MPRARLLWQLVASHLAAVAAAALLASWAATYAVEQLSLRLAKNDLEHSALLLAERLSSSFDPGRTEALAAVCRKFSRSSKCRITLVLPSGKVLFDSHEDAAALDNQADRPEIKQALSGGTGSSIRYSATRNTRMSYVAVPLFREERGPLPKGRVAAVVRAAMPLSKVDAELRRMQGRIAGGGLLVGAAAGCIALVFARRIRRPIDALRQGARRFAGGDLEYTLTVPDAGELADLAEALNQMARQLKDRLSAIARQTGEQQAVLASMDEGVLAVDPEERIISLNNAAAELLGTSPAEAQGRGLHEVVRHADLRRFVASALACESPVEGDMLLSSGRDRLLAAHGTALRDAAGRTIGAVVVLNDITRLRRLETLRRDFVANVSHELKTPITSIKGFVETLLSGAAANPDDAERFLRIISRQADRLDAIIEDLLSLSKIEQGEESGEMPLEERQLEEVLRAAVYDCEPKAAERRIKVSLDCPDDLSASINQPLFEQAVANLLDNAIKYSEPDGEVRLAAAREPGEVVVSVSDQGCGIAAEHLPRLFERFYRVDRGRSRKLGGTGLGLAIVKHIVQAHRGQITVESAPGKGSMFKIRLPAGSGGRVGE